MNAIAEKLVSVLDAAITGGPATKPARPVELAAEVILEMAAPIVKAEAGATLAAARKVYGDMQTVRHALNFELGREQADAAYRAQQSSHETLAASSGQLLALPRGRDLESWRADFEAGREAAKQADARLRKELHPLRTALLAVPAKLAADEAAELRKAETAAAARFGLAYKPGPTELVLLDVPNVINENRFFERLLELTAE